jgi:hypothetical protein
LESHCQKDQYPDPYQNVTDPEHWTETMGCGAEIDLGPVLQHANALLTEQPHSTFEFDFSLLNNKGTVQVKLAF